MTSIGLSVRRRTLCVTAPHILAVRSVHSRLQSLSRPRMSRVKAALPANVIPASRWHCRCFISSQRQDDPGADEALFFWACRISPPLASRALASALLAVLVHPFWIGLAAFLGAGLVIFRNHGFLRSGSNPDPDAVEQKLVRLRVEQGRPLALAEHWEPQPQKYLGDLLNRLPLRASSYWSRGNKRRPTRSP
jgi:hypothetical protein